MMVKRRFHYFRPGDLAGLERELDRQSKQLWQAERPGRFFQRYRREEGCFAHRIGYCAGAPGSADEIAYLAENERAGWLPGPRRKGWIVFCKPAADIAPDERLPSGREPVKALFSRRIARLERVRRWMLGLAALLLIGGYASALRPVQLCSLAPLLCALFVTYRIKFMEEGVQT